MNFYNLPFLTDRSLLIKWFLLFVWYGLFWVWFKITKRIFCSTSALYDFYSLPHAIELNRMKEIEKIAKWKENYDLNMIAHLNQLFTAQSFHKRNNKSYTKPKTNEDIKIRICFAWHNEHYKRTTERIWYT